ncbi:MAG: U32 family peptidase [Bacteroidaceae bacterium]|nr:U32 family peptidase [Bacteroidaceae bacterium]
MISKPSIELLAPAKNLECGLAAIDHGADAVYIGAPKFGARAAAGNSIDDIAQLVEYAHLFNVRIYVTLNTILDDHELAETERLIWELYKVHVDALIVQDMGITRLNLPPIPLHASTQMDNRTAEKVKFLAKAGFRQVVLARELTLDEIKEIHDACPEVALEVFVHGALCVSYSGQCYASQACFGRSANRGECAQFCRLPFHLMDADGQEIVHEKHLLSLKDMNQLDLLEQLMDAGATSFKIEGRLKEVDYVKNVTAAYRQRIDEILKRRTTFRKASSGTCEYSFTPNLAKSFNRGFTHYFLQGRQGDVAQFNTPKAMGEEMGRVKEVRGNQITVAGVKPFNNGDGVCFIDQEGKLQGFRVNRVEHNKLFVMNRIDGLQPKMVLYRNMDQQFAQALSKRSAERKIGIGWQLNETPDGFALTATDEDGHVATRAFVIEKQLAEKPQEENIQRQLSKLGNTPYRCSGSYAIVNGFFIPASVLSDWRRQVIEELTRVRMANYPQEVAVWQPTEHAYTQTSLTYLGNVMNAKAREFYAGHGVTHMDNAFEQQPVDGAVVMFCKHCIRFAMGWCPTRQQGKSPYKEPYFLQSLDGRRFKLAFDCKRCVMKIVIDNG